MLLLLLVYHKTKKGYNEKWGKEKGWIIFASKLGSEKQVKYNFFVM